MTQPLTASKSFSQARARKEQALAGLRELQLKERTGELVSRAAVTKATFAASRRVRDNLENIPSRIAEILAAESSQEKCFDFLRREIRQALEGLAGGPGT